MPSFTGSMLSTQRRTMVTPRIDYQLSANHTLAIRYSFNRDAVGSVNLSEWSHMDIWKDPQRCVGNLPQSQTGTLENPMIREE